MPDVDEALERPLTDALRGRVEGDKLRMRGFQIPQLAHQAVVLDVADFRRVLDKVQPVVTPDRGAELLDAAGCVVRRAVIGGGHAESAADGCQGCAGCGAGNSGAGRDVTS